MPATKRKLSAFNVLSKKRTKNNPHPTKDNEDIPQEKIVAVDELHWEQVSMPDRLDNAEGFFGLEEVDGVDVVRENGLVKFKEVRNDKKNKEGKRKAVEAGKKTEEKIEIEISDGKWDDGNEEAWEEWGGILSDTEGKKEQEKPKLKGILKKTSSFDVWNGIKEDKGLKSNAFSILTEESQEEETPLPDWTPLNLSPQTLRGIAHLKLTSPTPIQYTSIPLIIKGHDLIGKAPTGSGKTLAFGIPILERYLATVWPLSGNKPDETKDQGKNIQPLTALIISPTRELAHQISKHINDISRYTDMKTVTLTGGLSLQKQLRLLENGADVIVATPGRLWEVISAGSGWLDAIRKVKTLVLDEADRVLQEGHFKEVEQILDLMEKEEEYSSELSSSGEGEKPHKEINGITPIKKLKPHRHKKQKLPTAAVKKKSNTRQTLVFSATFHKGLQQKLAGKLSKKSCDASGDLMTNEESIEYLLKKLHFRESSPKYVDVNPISTLAEEIKEGIVECGAMEKDLYLYYLLLRYQSRTLVFVNSIYTVKRLIPLLNNLNLRTYPLHSRMIQKARLRSLERFSGFSSKTINENRNQGHGGEGILIATDVAARGLDIKNIDLVIHYHLPRTADMYVHRSGRTARASSVGVSILLCSPEEVQPLGRLIGKVHSSTTDGKGYAIKNFNIDRSVVNRLRRRVDLAKKIADSEMEKQKGNKEEDWLRHAAEELGVDLDEEGFLKRKNKDSKKKRMNRENENDYEEEEGEHNESGTRRKENAIVASKEEISRWKWELKEELKKKVNTGFSQKYLTSGLVNLAEHMLKGSGHDDLLGEDVRRPVDEIK